MPEYSPQIYFGGPDLPPRLLRNLLQARIDSVPAGGEIVWATYYFRDRALARALMAAADRGVHVTLHVEGAPRRKSANEAVLTLLAAHGLRGGLHLHVAGPIKALHPHLHSKIYYFSHPAPHALVGSFNPSGDEPEDAPENKDVMAEIGDQDRGHNMLVELSEPVLAAGLRAQVLGLQQVMLRWRPAQNCVLRGESASIWFYPRLLTNVIDKALENLDEGCRISGAISHMKQGALTDALMGAATRGVEVRLLVHDTSRRVPEQTIATLRRVGISVDRYVQAQGLPLHSKFLLIEERDKRSAWFGSFNYNPRSTWLNHELLVVSEHPAITNALATRFDAIKAQTSL